MQEVETRLVVMALNTGRFLKTIQFIYTWECPNPAQPEPNRNTEDF